MTGSRARVNKMAEVDKSLLAFMNGLSKRVIFGESGITDEFLRNEVLGGISEEGSQPSDFVDV